MIIIKVQNRQILESLDSLLQQGESKNDAKTANEDSMQHILPLKSNSDVEAAANIYEDLNMKLSLVIIIYNIFICLFTRFLPL